MSYKSRQGFACKVCGNVPDENGNLEHGRGCYTQSEDGGGSEYVEEADECVGKTSVRPWQTLSEYVDSQGGQVHTIGDSINHILHWIGDDPKREGLKDTAQRVVGSWSELFAGYKMNVEELMTVFEDGACDEMVVLRNIEFFSTCEHHMLPFHGKAHIAYLPQGKVIGISKLARVLEVYARRLQIQERIGQQVTQALDKYLEPKGSACILIAKHLCMTCRGVNKQNSEMVTSSLSGSFKESTAARAELMALIGGV